MNKFEFMWNHLPYQPGIGRIKKAPNMKIKVFCDGNINSAKIVNAETGETIPNVTKAHIVLDAQSCTAKVYLEFYNVAVNVHGNLDEINPPPGIIEDDINKH